jgi:hypothetical protein
MNFSKNNTSENQQDEQFFNENIDSLKNFEVTDQHTVSMQDTSLIEGFLQFFGKGKSKDLLGGPLPILLLLICSIYLLRYSPPENSSTYSIGLLMENERGGDAYPSGEDSNRTDGIKNNRNDVVASVRKEKEKNSIKWVGLRDKISLIQTFEMTKAMSYSIEIEGGSSIVLNAAGKIATGIGSVVVGPQGIKLNNRQQFAFNLIQAYNHGALLYRTNHDLTWKCYDDSSPTIIECPQRTIIEFTINDLIKNDNTGMFNISLFSLQKR